MKLNQEQIKEIIPQREPFLFVDEMVELEPGKCGKGIWHLTGDEWFFKGHFPAKKITPGVLITEALAQTGAVVINSHPDYSDLMGLFGGIKSMKFKHQVVPGDTLEMEINITRTSRNGGYADVKATVNGQVAAVGEIMTVFSKKI